MPSETGKHRKVKARRDTLKKRKAGAARKKKEAKKSTKSYAELFGETREEFEAKFAENKS
ncbi:MAG: hypothetical protein GXP49_16830 [Deltaproteobacteria bacterium]|nr:hypothetical protein [Deltaproteobacteria bacterium]